MFAGIDLGASALKVTLCDASGAVCANAVAAVATQHPKTGFAEQNPTHWLRALKRAFVALPPKSVRAFFVCAGTHSFVLLNAQGKVLHDAVLWSDQRAYKQAVQLERSHGDTITALAKNQMQPTWTLPILAWFAEHHKPLLEQTQRVCFAKDYIREYLCGAHQPHCTDLGDAVGSLMVNPLTAQWSETLYKLGAIQRHQLPHIANSHSTAGHLSKAAAKALGQQAGVPVYTGCIDTSAELLSAGAFNPGDALLKCASAGVWSRIVEQPHCHPCASLYPALGDHWYHATGTNNCAAALQWGARMLWGRSGLKALDAAIGRVLEKGVDADLPLFYPYLLGERAPVWRADVRALFVGVTLAHSRDSMAYAIAEGVAHALVHARDASELSQDLEAIKVTGGLTHLPNFMRMLASMLNQPLTTLHQADASYGAALSAAVAAGVLASDQLKDIVTRNCADSYKPEPHLVQKLHQRHRNYRKGVRHAVSFPFCI